MVDRSVYGRPGATLPTQSLNLNFLVLRDLKLSFRSLCEIFEVGQVVVADSRRRLNSSALKSRIVAECAPYRRLGLHLRRIHDVLVRNMRDKLF